jgi:hypothetical protein
LLAALAVVVVAGGVVAVSARETRAAVLGLTVSAVTVPLLADPLPGPLPLAARLLAAILAGYVLLISIRERPVTRGSRLGWPVEALLALCAAVAGLGAAGFAGPADGPPEAEAAAFALAALSIGPILRGADVFRLAIGLVLAILAAGLGSVALAGTPSPLDQIVVGGMTIVLAAAVATIAHAQARQDPSVTTTKFRIPLAALRARGLLPGSHEQVAAGRASAPAAVPTRDGWPAGTLNGRPAAPTRPNATTQVPVRLPYGDEDEPAAEQANGHPSRGRGTVSAALDRVRGRRS